MKAEHVSETSTFLATLKCRQSVVLRPQVSGRIKEIFVTSGNKVGAGTALMEIDPAKQAATVDSSDATVESSRAELINANETLQSLLAGRTAKVSGVEFAGRQFERYRGLRQQGAVSQENVDQYRHALDTAEAELNQCDADIRAQKAEIEKLKKVISQTRASKKQQEVELDYYTIKAPFAGSIGDVPVKIGQYVDSTTELTSVDKLRPLEVYIHVPAEEASKIKLGTPVQLCDSRGKLLGECRIFFVASRVDPGDQSVLLKALFDNANETLRSDQNVTAKIVWAKGRKVSVPTTAVSHLSGQDFVFVVESATGGSTSVIKQRPVELGEIVANRYLVQSGLKDGETVVISDVQNLVDGMPVDPKL